MKLTPTLVAATAAASLSVSTVMAQEPVSPTEFQGRLEYAHGAGPMVDGTSYYRYRALDLTDARLDGEITLAAKPMYFPGHSQPLWHGSFRIENEDGAWQEQPHLTLEFLDGTGSAHTTALIGEGDYEGLVAYTEFAYSPAGQFDIRGLIAEAGLPEPPVLSLQTEAQDGG